MWVKVHLTLRSEGIYEKKLVKAMRLKVERMLRKTRRPSPRSQKALRRSGWVESLGRSSGGDPSLRNRQRREAAGTVFARAIDWNSCGIRLGQIRSHHRELQG